MASPLLAYENSRLLVPDEGTLTQVNGRWVENSANAYLVKLFIKRAQYSGVSSGSKMLPLASQLDGEMMPGASGDQFYYRGYALEWVVVPSTWDLDTSDESALVWQQVTTQYSWLSTGQECQFRFGDDPIMPASKIQRSSGIFGGQGIDEIIYKELGGVQIQITGGELQN
jgi:hypothetical protein